MARFTVLQFDPGAYVASALEQTLAQTAQGPPLDPVTLICAVVSHHLALASSDGQNAPQNLRRLFLRA